MADSEARNAAFNGVAGSCRVQDGFLFFHTEQSAFKWSFATWIRSEKSKKTAKVRLTFTEGPLKLSPDESNADALDKAVIVADFGSDRDELERFCSLVSAETAASKAQKAVPAAPEPLPKPQDSPVAAAAPAPPKEDPTTALHRQRKRLLETNDDIAHLYQQLVETADGAGEGVISAEDFWSHHSVDLIAALKQPEAPSQLDGFIAIPPTNEFVNGQRLYRYNPELGRALLAEDATIRSLHKRFVLEKQYPEESFWKRILQSRHFYHLIGEKVPENQVLYDDIKGVPIRSCPPTPPSVASVLQTVDPYSEMISFDDYRKRPPRPSTLSKRFGEHVEPEFRSSLFDRFNAHASKIIDSREYNSAVGDSASDMKKLEERAEADRKRKIADVTCYDLAACPGARDSHVDDVCVIHQLTMPGQKRSPVASFEEARPDGREPQKKIAVKMRSAADVMRDTQQWVAEMQGFDVLAHIRKPMNNDNVSRRMFILNTKLCQTEKITQTVPLDYDPATVGKMRSFQMSIMEILQLYYRTLLPEEQKRVRLLLAIRQIKRNLESQQDGGISAQAAKALQTGLMNQITAVEVYDTKLRAHVADIRNQAQQRMSRPR
ncbi:uncharacterized protein BcabD6B2_09440 [Babesia caballi]|uniref:BSD domain-containing protein n=1 Tax=Babesia caballi TaxID=5871 RepID=A0AAV4LNH5_BABCB|nr:hypothetical protein BcabD6B2_09440 [Babesia caballi]